VIHILDRSYLSYDDYSTDLKGKDKTISKHQILKNYIVFLEDLKTIQKQQRDLLRSLIPKHKLTAVYLERLTEKNHEKLMELLQLLKNHVKNSETPQGGRDQLIEHQNIIGTAGQLAILGELNTLLPADDSKALEAAPPVRSEGKMITDKKAIEAREDAIVTNLLKADGVAVIFLSGDHDLTNNFKRLAKGIKYQRVAVPKYKEVVK
tara:strand:+ start:115239 stop:115859 length:621 start_codon:yes stop_codon:yes gene_type:complete